MPNHRVQAVKKDGKKRWRRGEIWEEHTTETGNHIETGNRRIWHKAPLQVYKKLSTPMFFRKDSHCSVPFITLCTLTNAANIASLTITDDQQPTCCLHQSTTAQEDSTIPSISMRPTPLPLPFQALTLPLQPQPLQTPLLQPPPWQPPPLPELHIPPLRTSLLSLVTPLPLLIRQRHYQSSAGNSILKTRLLQLPNTKRPFWRIWWRNSALNTGICQSLNLKAYCTPILSHLQWLYIWSIFLWFICFVQWWWRMLNT